MTEISYDSTQLQIADTTVELRYPVANVIEIEDVIIVLLKVPPEYIDNCNVMAFNQDGSHCWTIESASNGNRDNPYMTITENNGKLLAEAWNGLRYTVDLKSGEIRDGEIHRF